MGALMTTEPTRGEPVPPPYYPAAGYPGAVPPVPYPQAAAYAPVAEHPPAGPYPPAGFPYGGFPAGGGYPPPGGFPAPGGFPPPGGYLLPRGYPPPYEVSYAPFRAGGGTFYDAPKVYPVVLLTLLGGIWGAISASRRVRKARAMGAPTGRYWAAWGITLALAVAVIVPLRLAGLAHDRSARPDKFTATWIENQLVTNSDFKNQSGTVVKVSAATCAPDRVTARGVGTYACAIDFADGYRGTYEVTVDAAGAWSAQS
jgi:hypothetical protein